MKKKIVLISVLLVILFSGVIVYINQVILPTKVKAMVIKAIAEATQKKVSLSSLRISIFKGLVFNGLSIYDAQEKMLEVKEGSCSFVFLPFFRKQIIIPGITLKYAVALVRRSSDNTWNISRFLAPGQGKGAQGKFQVILNRVNLVNARINFQDDALTPAFNTEINNINLTLYLSLPAQVKFRLQCALGKEPGVTLNSAGTYDILNKQLDSVILMKNFSPSSLSAYYRRWGVSLSAGKLNARVNLSLKNNLLKAYVEGESRELLFSRDKIQGKINSGLKGHLQYDLKSSQFGYYGELAISGLMLKGFDFIDRVEDVSGILKFSNAGIIADNLNARVLGIPLRAKINLADFSHPAITAEIISALDLESAAEILKSKLKLSLPFTIQGQAGLTARLSCKLPLEGLPEINAALEVTQAKARLEGQGLALEQIRGRLEFDGRQLRWPGLNFSYKGLDFQTSGMLTDFKSPAVKLKLSAKDLELESAFAFKAGQIKLSKCLGQYRHSRFSFSGDLEITEAPGINADINAGLDVDLSDLPGYLPKFKTQWEQIQPSGSLHIAGSINGNLNEIKNCAIEAKLSAPSVSLYGLKAESCLLNYAQENKIADLVSLRLSLYDGTIEASGKMNLSSDNLPYWISADMRGVKIEKLKQDTAARDKDIAGTIQAEAKINGFYPDLSKLTAEGKVIITGGRLWELNLFKGLGALLFTNDFTRIVFNEGYCGFIVRDRHIFTDSLKLKSSLCDIAGSVNLGFDSSIDASLNVEVAEGAPLSGTLKDVTTAIIGNATKFGVIKITGTLKEPKYKFKPAVVDILKGLKDTFFSR